MIRMVANIYSRGQVFGISFDVARQWKEDKQCWSDMYNIYNNNVMIYMIVLIINCCCSSKGGHWCYQQL